MSVTAALVALAVGFGGVIVAAFLTRRNERRSHAEGLLAQALNDAVAAIAEVGSPPSTLMGGATSAEVRYASALARIVLHGPPDVVSAWYQFQTVATTATEDGQDRLVDAIQAARTALGHDPATDVDVRLLLFGPKRQPR